MSPIRSEDLSGLAPAVIVTAGFDPLVDQGEAYAKRLRDAGGQVVYRCYDNLAHAFVAFTGVVPCADVASRDIGGWCVRVDKPYCREIPLPLREKAMKMDRQFSQAPAVALLVVEHLSPDYSGCVPKTRPPPPACPCPRSRRLGELSDLLMTKGEYQHKPPPFFHPCPNFWRDDAIGEGRNPAGRSATRLAGHPAGSSITPSAMPSPCGPGRKT